MKIKTYILIFLFIISINVFGQKKPLQIGVIGLTHSHVGWVFNSQSNPEFEIVGIVEPNLEVARKYANQFNFSMDLIYPTIEELIQKKNPQAVTAFGNIYDHLKIVEICAPKGIHVMVEKPLAVNLEHAKKMESLAKKHQIHLLTNYETTWYPTNHKAYEIAKGESIGPIKKVVVRDGHRGPKKIGVPPEFFEWLTDPVLNGGGAITDFGCYGTNLLTWLMDGKIPLKVFAVTQQQQAENNPKVDDEAIIIVTYKDAVGIIEASWNWPIGRKDIEIYGTKGAIFADNKFDLRIRMAEGYDGYHEETIKLEEREKPYHDPFVFFAAVINKEVELLPYDLSSLENNRIAMGILDAAIRSAKKGKAVKFKQ
jgi:predicted dehydrogenase